MTTPPRTKALSLRAAFNCENAVGPRCKCRCGGRFHGVARVKDPRDLPVDDPHSPAKTCERCSGSGQIRTWKYPEGVGLEPCPRCLGNGRYLTVKMQRAPLPALSEVDE